ncbi:MAG: NAD(P)/FAD-dependent oxidoreductase [Bacteroidetes bacterium]|nr:NAD(P)/FAD-dependent oxidoreductase [Bacteroidota bacterium]
MKYDFDVIIVGGSYAGLSAAMALGRALRTVLIVDANMPANRFTPYSHNFLTQDGKTPSEIGILSKLQVDAYPTVKRIEGFVVRSWKAYDGFVVQLKTGAQFSCNKIILATGIIDILPDIPGFSDCWGKSVLHCPYCHGYEVRNKNTGIIGNGEYAFEFGALISNWTQNLTIFTNGTSILTDDQRSKLGKHKIHIVEDKIKAIQHQNGYLNSLFFENGKVVYLSVVYTRPSFKQHSDVPEQLGCELTQDGYIKIDSSQKTTVNGVFACGDNVTRLRTVANAVAMGTASGIAVNKDLVIDTF